MKRPLLLLTLMLSTVIFANAKQWLIEMTSQDLFSPSTITIGKGDTVVWKNIDTDDHTSSSGPNCTNTAGWNDTVPPGGTFKLAFPTAGTFPFHCRFHCAMGMIGTITVSNVSVSAITAPSFSNLTLKTFPNPFVQNVKVGFTLEKESLVKIEFTDLQGRTLFVKPEAVLAEGEQVIEFEGSSFGEGMIIFKMTIDGVPAASDIIVKASSK